MLDPAGLMAAITSVRPPSGRRAGAGPRRSVTSRWWSSSRRWRMSGGVWSLLRARAIWLTLTPMRLRARRTWARKTCVRRRSSDRGRLAVNRPVMKARTMSAAKPDSPFVAVLGGGLLEVCVLVVGEAQGADAVGALVAGEAADRGLDALHGWLAGGGIGGTCGAEDLLLDGVELVRVGAALGPDLPVRRALALDRLRHPRGGDPPNPALSRTRGTTGSARGRPPERPPQTADQLTATASGSRPRRRCRQGGAGCGSWVVSGNGWAV